MKNISRRVFIKGMAVAAAATAASTVLAGCNFVPGTEPEEVPGTVTDNVLSYVGKLEADEDKKFTFTITKLTKGNEVFGSDDKARLSVAIDNQMGNDMLVMSDLKTLTNTSDDDYCVVVSAYGDRSGDPVDVSATGLVSTSNKNVKNDNVTVGEIELAKVKDYSSVTIEVKLVKVLDKTNSVTNTVASKKFTYSL